MSFSKVISELEEVSQSITLTLSVDSAYLPDSSGRCFFDQGEPSGRSHYLLRLLNWLDFSKKIDYI